MADAATDKRNLWPEHPDYRVDFVPTEKRVRAVFAGETVADTLNARLMLETGHTPVYYFPRDDVRRDFLEPSDHTTFCPFKGDTTYWHLVAGDQRVENAVWSYPAPFPEKAEIHDWMAFVWSAIDHWYEEDEEIFVHPRDPYKRIDIRRSSRPVRVVVDGETVAKTRRARFLFETGLPTRFYIPPEEVRGDLLHPCATQTGCPYKGFARYWSLITNDRVREDLVWSYPEPLDEATAIKDLLCFYEERVDYIEVDGAERPRPRTKWSPEG